MMYSGKGVDFALADKLSTIQVEYKKTPLPIKLLKRLWRFIKFLFGIGDAPMRSPVGKYSTRIAVLQESIISITPGRRHAWINSNVGRIKKELRNIRPELLTEFYASIPEIPRKGAIYGLAR